MPVKSEREYRNIQIEEIRAKADDDQYVVEGYATKFFTQYPIYRSSDYEINEQIGDTAFNDCDMSDTIFQFDHSGKVYARTSNKTLKLEIDNIGLKVRAHLGGTAIGRELFEEIKGGYITKMSFGFIVDEDKKEETTETNTGKTTILRTITKIGKLFDVSAVSIPANDATEISARNFGEGVIEEVKKEIQAREARARQIQRIRILTEVGL